MKYEELTFWGQESERWFCERLGIPLKRTPWCVIFVACNASPLEHLLRWVGRGKCGTQAISGPLCGLQGGLGRGGSEGLWRLHISVLLP